MIKVAQKGSLTSYTGSSAPLDTLGHYRMDSVNVHTAWCPAKCTFRRLLDVGTIEADQSKSNEASGSQCIEF